MASLHAIRSIACLKDFSIDKVVNVTYEQHVSMSKGIGVGTSTNILTVCLQVIVGNMKLYYVNAALRSG